MERETQRQIQELPTEFAHLTNLIIRYQIYWNSETIEKIDSIVQRMHIIIGKVEDTVIRDRLHILLERWLSSTHLLFAALETTITEINDDESTKT